MNKRMSTPICSQCLDALRMKIRNAEEPNNPTLISQWMNIELPPFITPSLSCWKVYVDQFNLLLDTFADELIPAHWRQICLDSIYRPLFILKKLEHNTQSKVQVRQLFHELSITSQYVEASLIASYQEFRDK